MLKMFLTLILLALSGIAPGANPPNAKLLVPIDYYKLKNGLKVVLSQDKTAPTVAVAVYYNIGFRIEPKNRTGFAHLFEHMMFQGSKNLGKMEFIKLVQNNGGVLNGSTRFDFTNYFEIVPSHTLETMLWAEADRMSGLDITQANLENQQGVVKNEVKVNVLNQPYGGFPWLDLPQYANTNWYNAHNFYGDLKDLDNANLDDVKDFFTKYYAPNNAVLVIVGDFEAKQTKKWIQKYFGSIPSAPQQKQPDLSEPKQTREKRFIKMDSLAPRPAVAVGYQMPERRTEAYYAMGLLEHILYRGADSRMHQRLVKEKAYTGSVDGGINLLGNLYNYKGPMLMTISAIHDAGTSPDDILKEMDYVISEIANRGISQAEFDLALVKLRSQLYTDIADFYGFGKADLLASFALFDDRPQLINDIEDEFKKLTPESIKKAAIDYLQPSNRTVLVLQTVNKETK